MTERALHRKFPGSITATGVNRRGLQYDGMQVWVARTRHPSRDWTSLERRMLSLVGRKRLDETGWRDQKTGETGVPLQIHHVTKRSQGGEDCASNLEPLSEKSHRSEHERYGRA